MSGESGFQSVFKMNGRPILPPAMTPRRRREMQEYKLKALAVEMRLKQKELQKGNVPVDGKKMVTGNTDIPDEDGNKENSRVEVLSLNNGSKDRLFVGQDALGPVKTCVLDRETLKEISSHFHQKDVEEQSNIICAEPMPLVDLNYPDDGANSAAPTESTDLHPYLDSTLDEDISTSEHEFNMDCQGSKPYQSGLPHLCMEQPPDVLSKLHKLGLDFKLPQLQFSPFTYSEKCFMKGHYGGSVANSLNGVIGDMNTSKDENPSFSEYGENAACDFGENNVEDEILNSHLISEAIYQKKALGTKSCHVLGKTFISPERDLQESEIRQVCADSGTSSCSAIDCAEAESTSFPKNDLFEGNSQGDSAYVMSTGSPVNSSVENPPRLIRRRSFTLETASSLLCANIHRFSIDAVTKCDIISTVPDGEVQPETPAHQDPEQKLSSHPISSVICNSHSLPSSKRVDDGIKVPVEKSTHGAEIEPSKPPMKKVNREPLKATIRKGSVFDRLAADAAKRVEEKKRLSKGLNNAVFKVPNVKKMTKVNNRGMRPSLSTSNLRTSLSEAHRKRSNFLANKRSRSDVNVASTHGSCSADQSAYSHKKKPSAQVTSVPMHEKGISLKSRQPVNDKESSQPTEAVTETTEENHIPKTQESKDVAPSVAQSDTATPPEKSIGYWVQTSPISPPYPSRMSGESFSSGDTALQRGKRRRRWSEGWNGWAASVNLAECPNTVSSEKNVAGNLEAHPGLSEREDEVGQPCELEKETIVVNAYADVPETIIDTVSSYLHAPSNVAKDDDAVKVHQNEELPAETIDELAGGSEQLPDSKTSLKKSDDSIPGNAHAAVPSSNSDSETNGCSEFTLKITPDQEVAVTNSTGGIGVDSSIMPHNQEEGVSLITHINDTNVEERFQTVERRMSLSRSLVEVPSSLLQEIDSLPASPQGPKGLALHLLERLIEEQDKAMFRLLELQKQQAEQMQSRFKMQQKCLVERVVDLVSSLSTPRSDSGEPHSCLPDINHSNPICAPKKDALSENSSSNISERRLTFPNPLTPIPDINDEISIREDSSNKLPPPRSASSIEPLSDSKLGSELKGEEAKKLVNLSQHDKPSRVSSSPCPLCHLPSNACDCCSLNNSSCSSTVREEITTIGINSDEFIPGCDENTVGVADCDDSEEKTICPSSSSQEISDRNSPIPSSKVQNVNSCAESSNAMERSFAKGLMLDLSEIIEMELVGKNAETTMAVERGGNLSKNVSGFDALSSVKPTESLYSPNMMDDLSSYRQMYELDLHRIKSLESHSKNQTMESGKDCFLSSDQQTEWSGEHQGNVKQSKNEHAMDEASCGHDGGDTNKTNAPNDFLPDLTSDLMALQTYLGSQTPSSGPLTLGSPFSTSHQNLASAACSTPVEHLPVSSPNKLTIDFLNEATLKEKGTNLEDLRIAIEDETKENFDPKELRLSFRSSTGYSSCSDQVSQLPSERQHISSDSPSSGLYTTASSKSCNENIPVLENNVMTKIGKLSAFVKGYLTRRLMRTARVHAIKETIKDSLITALTLHSEVSAEGDVNPADVLLHGRILAQLTAACEEFHHVFFGLTKAQQMAIIRADSRRPLSAASLASAKDNMSTTPRPALLSSVTLKTLQRRFGGVSPVSKESVSAAHQNCSARQSVNRKKIASIPVSAPQGKDEGNRNTRPSRSRAKSINENTYSRFKGGNVNSSKPTVHRGVEKKTCKVPVKSAKKKRRSSSAGDVNRKPWR